MHRISSKCILLLTGLILFLCFIVFLVNYWTYQFPGNNYFPDDVISFALFLILLNLGVSLYFKKNSKPCLIAQELLYFFIIMSLIALATNAVQLTPFPTIDKKILTVETQIHINMEAIVRWFNEHTQLKQMLYFIYDTLPYQMSFLPLLIIFTCRFHLLREYYFYLLSTVLLGFGFYYFFPTTAPASVLNSSLFSVNQIATGLKFTQIHHHLHPTTNAGGLIALPSFHVIWAVLCVNLIKEWIIPCVLLALINFLLIISCVLLGWHYVTDLIGSTVILLISYYLFKKCIRSVELTP